jgi:hypothetical protein
VGDDPLEGVGFGFHFGAVLTIIVVVVPAVVVVLAIVSALGLTSFSALHFLRRGDEKKDEDSDDGGIDDLF